MIGSKEADLVANAGGACRMGAFHPLCSQKAMIAQAV